MSKFRSTPPGGCDAGAPVVDSTYLFDGDPCCSSCRGRMEVVDGVWVHASRFVRHPESARRVDDLHNRYRSSELDD